MNIPRSADDELIIPNDTGFVPRLVTSPEFYNEMYNSTFFMVRVHLKIHLHNYALSVCVLRQHSTDAPRICFCIQTLAEVFVAAVCAPQLLCRASKHAVCS